VHYWSRHLADLAVIALPMLRPLRLLRLLMLLRVLNRRATASLRGRVAIYVGGAAVLLLLCASLAVLDAERHAAGANITTFGEALWWSAVTVSTVGYGDRYPVTNDGRLVAVGLMLGGIALIGVVTASFAAWLVDRVRETEVETQAISRHDLEVVMAKLDQIADRLAAIDVRPPTVQQPRAVGESP
jgi:voltage-gated potassium channel